MQSFLRLVAALFIGLITISAVGQTTSSSELLQSVGKAIAASDSLESAVRDNKSEDLIKHAEAVQVAALNAKKLASVDQTSAAKNLVNTATALVKVCKDGTIAENWKLVEQLRTDAKALEVLALRPRPQTHKTKEIGNRLCPVSGHPVGSMQKGSHLIFKNQKVGLCCDSCTKKFNTNPEGYLQKALKSSKP